MGNLSVKKIILTAICLTCTILPTKAQDATPVTKVDPPLFGFYTKSLDSGGILIRSSAEVDDKALQVAAQKINLMLANIPDVRHNLAQWGAGIHIIGKNQQTSDLPEFHDQKGVSFVDNSATTNIDVRTRGIGGIYTSCGEENLLNLPGDRYAGSDICMHEFAHNIMFYGLDDSLSKKIDAQYKSAIKKGLWPGAYASVNAGEYWAELSMWYFGAHGEFLKGTKLPAAGAAGLKAYDPEGYALLASIYSGKLKPAITDIAPAKNLTKGAKSAAVNIKARLMFTNNMEQKLKLFWIDYLGKARAYGTVSPYSKAIQKTFVGNVWRVETEKGKVIGYYAATTPNAMVKLE
ncbi:hypothetical protein [Mucilaginibacter sp. UYCu711]|uniref:VHL beta domain-containing protein n=1 Tax=Mucilaginibacter sp. UYCu711 TaxID=3156339 RepID=UPI003D215DE5